MRLIVIRGPGGTGKSTAAQLLAEHLRASERCALLSSDDFYWGVSGEEHDDELVFEALSQLCDLYLSRGYSVLIEGQLTSRLDGRLRIEHLIEHAQKRGASTSLFYLDAELDIVQKRIAEKFTREGWPFNPKEVREWYARTQERRLDEEITIDATEPPERIVQTVLKHLNTRGDQ